MARKHFKTATPRFYVPCFHGTKSTRQVTLPCQTADYTRLFLFRGNHHHHLTTFEARELLHDPYFDQIGLDALEQRQTDFLVRHFTTAETQRDLGLVAIAQETDQVA